MHSRERLRKRNVDIDSLRELPVFDYAPDEILTEGELRILFLLTIEGMPPKQREAYELSRMEGLSNVEIAQKWESVNQLWNGISAFH